MKNPQIEVRSAAQDFEGAASVVRTEKVGARPYSRAMECFLPERN